MFEKLQVAGIKREIISELRESIEKYFWNELLLFKAKWGELVSKSNVNRTVHIEKLENKRKSKDEIVNNFLIS